MTRAQSRKRDLLTLLDLDPKEIGEILVRAREFKGGERPSEILQGKVLGLFFEKSSTRTRISFEVAAARLGGSAIFLTNAQMQISRGELLEDTVRVLGRYLDGIVVRTFSQETLALWAAHARVPVINGLTDLHHPCQILGDLLTIREKLGELKGRKIAYVGDGNNVAHSLIEGAAAMGMRIALACPEGYRPDPKIVSAGTEMARRTGGTVEITADPREAVRQADAVYTDVWTSMGQEEETAERNRKFQGYQVNSELLALAAPGALVLHCLPAHRGEE
ncbi:MAG: ornithine carbamoyltransferase, partial [Nitrospirae bacterium]|nr:ornithine carbamoyltransferase [Nitrospirota bacterium]